MNPTVVIVILGAVLLLSLYFDRRRGERDLRAEESSVAIGFKKWLLGSHDAPLPAEPAALPEVPKTLLRVSGSVPPEMWNRLGTEWLAKLPSGAQVSVALDVSFAVDASQAQEVTANLSYMISELELSGLRIALVDQGQGRVPLPLAEPGGLAKRSKPRRVIIRFRELNPLMQALLPVRAAQL